MLFLDADKIFSIFCTCDLIIDEKISCIVWDSILLMLIIEPIHTAVCHFIDVRPLRQAMQDSHTPSHKRTIDRYFQK